MLSYVFKRLLWMIPVLLGVTLIVFTLLHFAPGDPATLALGIESTPAERDAWRAQEGLDKPFFVQYAKYCYNAFVKLDFGKSYASRRPIISEIQQRLPKTLLVVLFSIILMQLVGVPIGIISAVRQYSFTDNLVMILALLGVSMPSFWVGLMLSIVFALNLRWLPASGLYGPKYFILPSVALALAGIAMSARLTRSCMLDVIRQDYITTARAKGVSERMVINKHALRNALIPIITQTGMGASILIGGAMVTEVVFAIPGMGTYMVNSIRAMDYPAVLGAVVVIAVCASLILLLMDLGYALVDPRIRSQFKSKKALSRGARP
jgi:peptide/nickel transport system permease protein